jgi:glycosyltransferase involved in cell wall biosynthesis
MNILYDHQIFSSQVFGGISRYFYELMDSFHRDGDVCFSLALRYSNNAYLQGAGWTKCKPFFPGRRFFGKTTLINTLNGYESRRSIGAGGYDILHPTYYHPYYLPLVGKKPVVVTVYDMTHELYPGLFSADDPTIAWKRAVLGSAQRIIAISENTKRDLLRFYRLEEQRVAVVHLASSLRRSMHATPVPDLPANYLLFVGQRGGYKNFSFFVRTLAPLLRSNPELAIVCAGGGAFTPQEADMLASLGIISRVRQVPVSDDALVALYGGALAFVFPSLYEGFGIPVLEAFSCGCPVLLSNRSSLPEVGGEAVVYFDPEDEESFRRAVVRVMDNAGLRESLAVEGRVRAGEFSWEKVARETRAVYESVL